MAVVEMTAARYGKDHVRLLRVVRGDKWQEVAEYTVCAMLEGDIAPAFIEADNSVVVATDTIKNTIYLLAKTSPYVLQPETFALELALHFVTTYPHIHKAFVDIEQQRWTRIPVDGIPHPHSFIRDGEEKRLVSVSVDASEGKDRVSGTVTGGITGLLVMKSTGSAFQGYIKDQYTTLPEVSDRVLSTAVHCTYTLTLPPTHLSVSTLRNLGVPFDDIYAGVRQITLDIFTNDESASVQATIYKMAERIIEAHEAVASVSYRLPNKHYIPVDLSWFHGLKNTKPDEAEVFFPAEFYGTSTTTVVRKAKKA